MEPIVLEIDRTFAGNNSKCTLPIVGVQVFSTRLAFVFICLQESWNNHIALGEAFVKYTKTYEQIKCIRMLFSAPGIAQNTL